MAWTWNPIANRYQWRNGSARFLSRNQIMEWVRSSLNSSGSVSDTLSGLVHSGRLSPLDWHSLMREEIKREYIRQYLLGIGGRNNMTQSDWGRIGGMLKEQYTYLDRFRTDIQSSAYTEDQIRELMERARSRMYINSGREAFERATAKMVTEWGAVEENWELNPFLNNCPDCIDFSFEGWQPFGHFPFPGDGSTVCLTNCGCTKAYRDAQGRTYAEEMVEEEPEVGV